MCVCSVKTADVLDSLRDFVASQSRFLNNENSSLYDSVRNNMKQIIHSSPFSSHLLSSSLPL